MNILEVANNKDEIFQEPYIECPICGERLFSPFDKLYISAYGMCYTCDTDDTTIKSDNIFGIL